MRPSLLHVNRNFQGYSVLAVFTRALFFLTLASGCHRVSDLSTVTDIDGNVYNTVTIGDQVWMAENLCVTRYRNGDTIANVRSNEEWSNLEGGAYCNYNDDTSAAHLYGRLYNWYAVNDPRNIAPEGWHIPNPDEVTTLMTHLGGDTVAGARLKESGIRHWLFANGAATNESGFSALPGGYRFYEGTFHTCGSNGYWWSGGRSYELYAWSPRLYTYFADVERDLLNRNLGLSVRCVKDP
jgi:uncharacterized protein (TIGR02145 family)